MVLPCPCLCCAVLSPRAADKGFVPQESNAVPDADSAGQAGGVSAGAVGDMADMVGAVFSGDAKRAGKDVADMTHTAEGDLFFF